MEMMNFCCNMHYFSIVYILTTDYHGMINKFPYILKNILVEKKLHNHYVISQNTVLRFQVSSAKVRCYNLTEISEGKKSY